MPIETMHALLNNRVLIFININLQPLTNILTKMNVPFLFAADLRLTTVNYDPSWWQKKKHRINDFFCYGKSCEANGRAGQ